MAYYIGDLNRDPTLEHYPFSSVLDARVEEGLRVSGFRVLSFSVYGLV